MTTSSLFISQLKEARPALVDFLNRAHDNQLEAQDWQGLQYLAEILSRDGTQAGYPLLAQAAATVMSSLAKNTPEADCFLHIQTLHANCHAALLTLPNTPMPQRKMRDNANSAQLPIMVAADDDRIVCNMIEEMCEHVAHVIIVHDGIQAHAAILNHKPKLVILDDIMPGITGLSLLEKLRKDPLTRHLRIIMLTASDRKVDLCRANNASVLDYIFKPFDPQAVAIKLIRFLESD